MRILPIILVVACTALVSAFGDTRQACDPDNAELSLPDGFCATLFAEVDGARHVAVAPNGDVYVAVRGRSGGLVVLRDNDGDGRADEREELSSGSATGVAVSGGFIYLGHDGRIVRYPWSAGTLGPAGEGVTVVSGLPTGGHGATTLAIGRDNDLFVDHGSRSNTCQDGSSATAAGELPCSELPTRAGVWRYDASATRQTPSDGIRWATGLRNAMALAVEPNSGQLFGAIHGRDRLHQSWGFSAEDGAEKPAEEFGPISQGDDYGWPYCYYDPITKTKVQAPEYGGDGVVQGECATKTQPAIGFPGHWAPMALAFYTHDDFGPEYTGGAFLAFHGSWNRAPLPQAGYRVVFVPFSDGQPTGEYQTFATSASSETGLRASGVAVGPDGALFISSDGADKLWRVIPNK